MRLFRYMYYRFYQLIVSVGNGDIASFASILFMSFTIGLNVLTLFEILDILKVGIGDISKISAIVSMTMLTIILYLLLVFNGGSPGILHQYEKEPTNDRRKGMITVILYIIISIGMLLSTFLIMASKNKSSY